MKKIAILTSGGDSQGMNAAVRAATKAALNHGMEVYGIYRGYKGLLNDDIRKMDLMTVANIAAKGGTMLMSARLPEFRDPAVRTIAADNLKKRGIEGLIVIGGDGSYHGAYYLYKEHGIKTVGIPGTIDNDIAGTDQTIGYDTALNIIISSISKLVDTARSHEMTFFVEVMGRNCGDLALNAAIASGANGVMIPEVKTTAEDIAEIINKRKEIGKTYNIILVAEGVGKASDIGKEVEAIIPGLNYRSTVLGHVQRGGAPSAYDRLLATKMGIQAVELLLSGEAGKMVGIHNTTLITHPLEYAWENYSKKSQNTFETAKILLI